MVFDVLKMSVLVPSSSSPVDSDLDLDLPIDPVDIALFEGRVVFWSDDKTERILSVEVNGGNTLRVIIDERGQRPRSLAIDSQSR